MSNSDNEKWFAEYVQSFHNRDVEQWGKYLSPSFHAKWMSVPAVHSREEAKALMRDVIFPRVHVSIRPTYLTFGERSISMECIMDAVAQSDLPEPYPYTGKPCKKGDRFSYPMIVHYELDENRQFTTWRQFSRSKHGHEDGALEEKILPGF